MMENVFDLPKGWTWASLEEIIDSLRDGTHNPPTRVEEGIPLLSARNIKDGFIDFEEGFSFISEKDFFEISKNNPILRNDILLTIVGTIGRACVCKLDKEFTVQRSVAIIRTFSDYINPTYIQYLFISSNFRRLLSKGAKGTAQMGIYLNALKKLPIQISPFPEQHRIVAKIEELFTKLDAGVEALKKIKEQLKRYRQAVLKYAFEGKLTQEWREAHKGKIEPASVLLERIKEERKKNGKGKYKELPPIDTSELSELPEGWEWTRVGEIMEVVRGASPRPKGDPRYFGGDIPWIMISDISKEKGKYISTTRDTVTEEGKGKSRYLKAGTLILSNSGTVCVPKILAVNGCIHDGFVAFPDLSDNLEIFYCYYFFDHIRPKIIQENKQGVTQVNLNTDIVRNMNICLPSQEEQKQIFEEIESRLSVADEVEKVAEQSLKQSERLRQSILKQAFEGKLVSQDPTDEPAEKLLERIRGEKARQEAENKREKEHKNKKTKQMELI